MPASYLDGSLYNLLEFSEWAWTFDTVIVGGLALCNLYPIEPLPTNISVNSDAAFKFGSSLYAEILTLNLPGLSGTINFDQTTGDRNPLTSYCTITDSTRLGVRRCLQV